MNMPMPSDPTVANLPLSDPQCVLAGEACIAFYAAVNASQAATPWAGQFAYGRWLSYYYVGILGIATAIALWLRWADVRKSKEERFSAAPFDRAVALARYFSYRSLQSAWLRRWAIPSLGMLCLLLVSIVFITALVFTERPYYRKYFGYGSPPIAIRTGVMATALTPLLIALSGKVNLVTFLTSISHEKLNVIHQWVGWVTLVLSLIHTIPFFIASVRMPGDSVRKEFYSKHMSNELSGVPPLAMLLGLCLLSIPPVRRRAHEIFYNLHVLLAITYFGLLFWHSYNNLDTWTYLWVTLAIWLLSWLARAFGWNRSLSLTSRWFVGEETSLSLLPGGMTKIEVTAPANFRSQPGQHVYLRFPTIGVLHNHPFTIVNAPISTKSITGDAGKAATTLTFLARQRSGFTKSLASHCDSETGQLGLSAWLDGPYGGVNRPIERSYDQLILCAGGSGITPCISWLSHVARLASASNSAEQRLRLSQVTLLWVMRAQCHCEWVYQEISEAVERGKSFGARLNIKMVFFVTDQIVDAREKEDQFNDDKGKTPIDIETLAVDKIPNTTNTSAFSQMCQLGSCETGGRPDLAKVLPGLIEPTSEKSGGASKTFVFVCGPESMAIDVTNICASEQSRVFGRGEMKEIALHTESFSL